MTTAHRPPRRLGTILLLGVLCLPLQSCFTLLLWGGVPELEADHRGKVETGWTFEDADIGWGDVWLRILLTPAAVCLDCVTLPVQAFLQDSVEGDDEETEAQIRRRLGRTR
jgi:hypothetical protein